MTKRGVNAPHLVFAGMSQAHRAGDVIDIAGQVALRDDGTVVSADDVEGQAEQCFTNMASVLHAAGASLSDVTQLTCYLTDAGNFAGYSSVKNRIFATDPPACTTVIVSALLNPDFLMEVAATARVRTSAEQENP